MIAVIVILFLFSILLIAVVAIRFQMKNKLERAISHLTSGEYKEALKIFKGLYTRNASNKLYNWYIGQCYEHLRNYELAIVEYNKAALSTSFNPPLNEAEIHERIALMSMKIGNRPKAEQEFKVVTSLDPDNARAFYYLGVIAKQNNALQQGIEYLNRAVQIMDEFTEAYLELGKLSYALNNYEKAKYSFLKVISNDPSSVEAHFYLALILERDRSYEKSIEEFEYALRDEQYKFDSFVHLGLIYIALSDTVKAFEYFDKAMELGTSDVVSLAELKYTYANHLIRSGDINRALALWKEVLSLQPNYKDTVHKLEVYGEVSKSANLTRLMTASKQDFFNIGRSLCRLLKVKVGKHQFGKENFIEFIGTIPLGRDEMLCVVHIARWTSQVGEMPVRELLERMSEEGAGKGIFITTSVFSAKALKHAKIRPIELINKERLDKMLMKVFK